MCERCADPARAARIAMPVHKSRRPQGRNVMRRCRVLAAREMVWLEHTRSMQGWGGDERWICCRVLLNYRSRPATEHVMCLQRIWVFERDIKVSCRPPRFSVHLLIAYPAVLKISEAVVKLHGLPSSAPPWQWCRRRQDSLSMLELRVDDSIFERLCVSSRNMLGPAGCSSSVGGRAA